MNLVNTNKIKKDIDALFKTQEEINFVNKYIELKETFKEYVQNLKRVASIRISLENEKAIVCIADKKIHINENAKDLVMVFVNYVIKNNKSQLIKRYDNISLNEQLNSMTLNFSNLRDIDDIILYQIDIISPEIGKIYEEINSYFSSLIEEPSVQFTRKMNL